MFNSPRQGQRYIGATTNGFSGSLVDENPLASSSVYDDGLQDPWSAAPSPSPTPVPQNNTIFNAVIADATVPGIYHRAFAAVDVGGLGEVSVNALSRVLTTSSLPAATVDKIVNLVSSKPRVSKLEFFVALALVALAQSGKDVSIEQVAALSSQNTLPEPTLDLDRLQPSTSTFAPTPYRQNTAQTIRPAPAYSDDPWSTNKYTALPANPAFGSGTGFNPAPPAPPPISSVSSVAGTGLPDFWWKRQENVRVTLLGQQGFILNRYVVYEIATERGDTVVRRYSEFSFLWDCLQRRYPFRLFPALPPKRIGADEQFLEQRRKGLARALNFVINHPVIKDDGILASFLTEPSFETWRKTASISLDEESASKKVDKVEEMAIPSDFEEKIATIRAKLNPLIDHWQRICILAERIMKRQEAAARQAELSEDRTRILLDTTLEALKSQRDLYLATRDMFIRHDRLSIDQVERLKKRIETHSVKLDGIRAAQKDGWAEEADRLTGLIERDQATVTAQLNRRVFIRVCLWHELRVVLHNRENTLITQAVHNFAREERQYSEGVTHIWQSLEEATEGMPYE
ncbi:hypothetical protein EST38_g4198 [Candolleomyces aberdarensis]|uniref:Sorting nexin MVP1 n=1 Tax=Candolleomyces aberdarensis TaxID=2316362 RepID=A0A4Q2DRK7_9AGAR|nr:hypothetical protein EST38_g4198 [Candolleomyces aberdarensis]